MVTSGSGFKDQDLDEGFKVNGSGRINESKKK